MFGSACLSNYNTSPFHSFKYLELSPAIISITASKLPISLHPYQVEFTESTLRTCATSIQNSVTVTLTLTSSDLRISFTTILLICRDKYPECKCCQNHLIEAVDH